MPVTFLDNHFMVTLWLHILTVTLLMCIRFNFSCTAEGKISAWSFRKNFLGKILTLCKLLTYQFKILFMFNLILFNLSSIMVVSCSFLLKENKSYLKLESVGRIKSIPLTTNKYRKELPTLISHNIKIWVLNESNY